MIDHQGVTARKNPVDGFSLAPNVLRAAWSFIVTPAAQDFT